MAKKRTKNMNDIYKKMVDVDDLLDCNKRLVIKDHLNTGMEGKITLKLCDKHEVKENPEKGYYLTQTNCETIGTNLTKTRAFETLENMEKALKLKKECPEKKPHFY